jgi:phosphomethylpyrimidine synthase
MTQLELARKGIASPQMKHVAETEGVATDFIVQGLIEGKIVVPANVNHPNLTPCGIGTGLRTKVNANIGTSSDSCRLGTELRKLQTAIGFGADTVMDLSTGGDISAIRKAIMSASTCQWGRYPYIRRVSKLLRIMEPS